MAHLAFKSKRLKPYDLSNLYWACDCCGGEITHKNDPPRGLNQTQVCTCNSNRKFNESKHFKRKAD